MIFFLLTIIPLTILHLIASIFRAVFHIIHNIAEVVNDVINIPDELTMAINLIPILGWAKTFLYFLRNGLPVPIRLIQGFWDIVQGVTSFWLGVSVLNILNPLIFSLLFTHVNSSKLEGLLLM